MTKYNRSTRAGELQKQKALKELVLIPNMHFLINVWTHAGELVLMDMTPDTKTSVPTTAAGSSQAV